MLGGFGFQFSRGTQVRHQGEVHNEGVLWRFPLHLAHRLDVGKRLNVAHRSTNLCDDEVVVVLGPQNLDASLDFVRDVRDDLDRLAEVFSAPLLVDHALVDAAGRDVVGLRGLDVQETFVVPEVQIRFRAVHSHIAFPMLVGIQGPWIHIDVRIELLDGHFVASCLKEFGQRGADDALAQTAAHSPRDKDVAAVAPACEGV